MQTLSKSALLEDPPTDTPADDQPGPPVDEGRRPIFAFATTGADLLADIRALIGMARDTHGLSGFTAHAQRLVEIASDPTRACDKLHRLDAAGRCVLCEMERAARARCGETAETIDPAVGF